MVYISLEWDQSATERLDDYVSNFYWRKEFTTESLWSYSDTNLHYNSGNVGIGTTNPSVN